MRQTEAKGRALADAFETSAKSAILGNSLLEEQISQRLLTTPVRRSTFHFRRGDQEVLKEISAQGKVLRRQCVWRRCRRPSYDIVLWVKSDGQRWVESSSLRAMQQIEPVLAESPAAETVLNIFRKMIWQQSEASCTPTASPHCRSLHIRVDQAFA